MGENKTLTLGIEFGSTRIKAVLIDESKRVVASGVYDWENTFADGYWTYSSEEIINGMQKCYGDLKKNYFNIFGVALNRISAIGISAMMHGYLALDKNYNLLVPFRTWRNSNASSSADKLTRLFHYPIPARWSIAHLYQAIVDEESHTPKIGYLTTMAGYIHYLLTGERVLGIGEASGMFPIDGTNKNYDSKATALFDDILSKSNIPYRLNDILPKVLVAGQNGGELLPSGARLLDPEGDLLAGIPLCPPEGDAGTGMVATNSVRKGTGNISAGTSIFGMIVLDKPLANVHKEIDVVTTPSGDYVAMVHCNNCTSEINAWANIFEEMLLLNNSNVDKNNLFTQLFNAAKQGDVDCGNLIYYNYTSGEHIAGIDHSCPLMLRTAQSRFNLPNFMRMQIYSAFATLRIGMDVLTKQEDIKVNSILAHGGIFKTKGVAQQFLASALNTQVAVNAAASEGGAFGMALLASYLLDGKGVTLADYLDKAFKGQDIYTCEPNQKESEGFNLFLNRYISALPVVHLAINKLYKNHNASALAELKQRVFKANLDLVKHGLVVFTWGNVSEINRELGLVAIKPSGVAYESMTADDIVVVNMDGEVVEGRLKPSSDLPTHLELYKAFPSIGGVVHTHSTYATAWAQSMRELNCYGTTHADYFYGSIPTTRELTKAETVADYEVNTGKVIVETFIDRDYSSCPAVLVASHGPFSWGVDAFDAVHNAVVLEEVAKMATISISINNNIVQARQYTQDKHYNRKHGKNAYYGQNKK